MTSYRRQTLFYRLRLQNRVQNAQIRFYEFTQNVGSTAADDCRRTVRPEFLSGRYASEAF